jgi:hypothetical protein
VRAAEAAAPGEALVASPPRQNMPISSDFLAPSKPTRGLEPRNPIITSTEGYAHRAYG